MPRQIPSTPSEFRSATLPLRVWWCIRPYAVRHAADVGAAPAIQATVRSWHQITRTWTYSFCAAIVIHFIDSRWHETPWNLTNLITLVCLVAAQIGAFLAVRRSNESRAYIGHVQEQVEILATRSVFASVQAHLAQRECASAAAVAALTSATLDVLSQSRSFPQMKAFSLWARDETHRCWRIVAAIGVDAESIAKFRQDFLETETPGGGVVANLAVTAERQYYHSKPGDALLGKAEWFARNPYSENGIGTLAVFILPGEDGTPTGAFALTSDQQDVLERARTGQFPRHVQLLLDQCTVSLVGLAIRATQLWHTNGPPESERPATAATEDVQPS